MTNIDVAMTVSCSSAATEEGCRLLPLATKQLLQRDQAAAGEPGGRTSSSRRTWRENLQQQENLEGEPAGTWEHLEEQVRAQQSLTKVPQSSPFQKTGGVVSA